MLTTKIIISNLMPIADYLIKAIDEKGVPYAYLLKKDNESCNLKKEHEIVSVQQYSPGSNAVKFLIWDRVNGWDKEAYEDRVVCFASLIDHQQGVCQGHHIENCINDDLTPMEAASDYFEKDDVNFDIQPSDKGWCEYVVDITGANNIHQATFKYKIQNGHTFFALSYKEDKAAPFIWDLSLRNSVLN